MMNGKSRPSEKHLTCSVMSDVRGVSMELRDSIRVQTRFSPVAPSGPRGGEVEAVL